MRERETKYQGAAYDGGMERKKPRADLIERNMKN
jgi:hypothetical protein